MFVIKTCPLREHYLATSIEFLMSVCFNQSCKYQVVETAVTAVATPSPASPAGKRPVIWTARCRRCCRPAGRPRHRPTGRRNRGEAADLPRLRVKKVRNKNEFAWKQNFSNKFFTGLKSSNENNFNDHPYRKCGYTLL